MSCIVYDGSSTLSLRSGATPPDPSVSALSLGNGKIAIVPAMGTIDSVQSMITGAVRLDQGRFDSGAINNFRYNRVRAFGEGDTGISYKTVSLSLSMDTSIFSQRLEASSATGGLLGAITTEMYAHSTLPYCFVQTVTVSYQANLSTTPPVVSHEIYSDAMMSKVKFNTSVLHVPSLASPLYMFLASGETDAGSGMSEGSQRKVSVGCCYLFDETKIIPQGFNVYADDRRRAYSRLSLVGNLSEYKFHILTATMSSDDFENPEEEVRRILLNVAGCRAVAGKGAEAIATKLRSDHVGAWLTRWSNSITITPKIMASASEKAIVLALQRASRFALYNLLSNTRTGARISSDPALLSVMDADGSLLYKADVWFLPVLLLLRPDCAKSVLEYRHKTIDSANRLAQCYGYAGAKYGYVEDVVGYSSSVYFDNTQPQHLYNSSLIAIAAWNQYRATNDSTWLQSTGYDIMRGVADFLCSAAVPSETVKGQYSFINVLGYGSSPCTDNTLTVATAILAIKYAMQASYVLSQQVRSIWIDVSNGLILPVIVQSSTGILVNDQSYTTLPSTVPAPMILDCLMPLLPWYQESVFPKTCSCAGNLLISKSLAAHIDYYQLKEGLHPHPYNVALLAGLCAVACQSLGRCKYLDMFDSLITSFVETTTDADLGWGNFVDKSRKNVAPALYPTNDLNLASLLLFVMMNCVAGVQIRGLVTDTRYFAEKCQLKASDNGILPNTWTSLTVSNVGLDMNEVTIVNQLVYQSQPFA